MKKDDELKFNRISNGNMLCKDCVFRLDDSEKWGNATKCKQFLFKPNNVLLGDKNCIWYNKEDD